MTKNKTKSFRATIVRDCILKSGTNVTLVDDGCGSFFVQTANGHSTTPMSLWVKEPDFHRYVTTSIVLPRV